MTLRVLFSACIFAIGSSRLASAQFIKEGSIGKAPVPQSEPQIGSCPFQPLAALKGQRLLFLPGFKSIQKYGYQGFEGGTGEYGQPTYKEAVGRTGVLSDIVASPSVIGTTSYTIKITMLDNQQIYTYTSVLGEPDSIRGVAFISDLECAQKQLLGKTIWYVGAGVDQNGIKVYDEATDKVTKLDLPKPARLQVKEVVASWFSDKPARLILLTDTGAEAFVDVSLSGMNIPKQFREFGKFGDSFTLEDPRKLYNWPDRAWQAIQDHKVYVGMTQQQVAFSWGKPLPSNIKGTIKGSGSETWWRYDALNLYFENGVLTAMQNN
jgi:hypothetical protein